eukprot:2760077-Pyramimonas_sp.AAC.1
METLEDDMGSRAGPFVSDGGEWRLVDPTAQPCRGAIVGASTYSSRAPYWARTLHPRPRGTPWA